MPTVHSGSVAARGSSALLPALLCALLAALQCDTAGALPAGAPRVILMQLSDDFGWANWGYHGTTNYTPNLDALAREGVVLSRTYVFNLCSPSRCALQTGRNPVHVNVVNSPIQQHNPADTMSGFQGVPLNMTGIAEKLKSAGYATAAYGKWNAGMAHERQTPAGRGYDHALTYFDYDELFWSERTIANCSASATEAEREAPGAGKNGTPMVDLYAAAGPAHGVNNSLSCSQSQQTGPNCTYSDDVFAAYAVAAIAEAGRSGQPLFLFWAPHAPHDPYEAPTGKLAQFPGIAQEPRHYYTAMASLLDDNVGKVRDALHAAGLWEETLWIMSSDNGGPTGDGYGGNNWPNKGGKASNWEGGIRVNAFATGGFLPAAVRGTTVEGLIGIEDFYTTFCALAGVDPADAAAAAAGLPPVDGLDMWPLISGANTTSPRAEVVIGTTLAAATDSDSVTSVQGVLRADGWKLLIGSVPSAFWQGPIYPNASGYPSARQDCGDPALPASDAGAGPGCLYNVLDDPTEQHDRAAEQPAIVAALRARIAAHNATVFSPHRGADDGLACKVRAQTGFWGPFL